MNVCFNNCLVTEYDRYVACELFLCRMSFESVCVLGFVYVSACVLS